MNLQAVTDAEGRFVLNDLPADAVEFDLGKKGFESVSNVRVTPSDKENLLTLRVPVRIIGSVVDAETGKPLEEFVLIQGTDYEDGRAPWWPRWGARKVRNDGFFETTLQQPEFAWRLRVEAKGYLPGVSRIFRMYNPDEGEVIYDFKLTKAPPLTGTVIMKGKPVANADVYLATQAVNLTNRKVARTDDRPPVKTDAAGRFEFPPESEPFCIVVVHELGVGMITEKELATSAPVAIKPWSSENETLQIIRTPTTNGGEHVDFPKRQP